MRYGSSWFPALLLALSIPCVGRAADGPLVIDLWPDKPPGDVPAGEEKLTGNKGSRALTNVSKPTITIYRPGKEKDTGVAIVIAPGGGYNILAWDHEGEDVAAWLNSVGITGVLLKYRVPAAKGQARDEPSFAPHQDAQRAISLVRGKAKEWNVDPSRIGMLGFSAGGHLTAMTATNFAKRGYEPVDDADKVSCRLDFAVMIYPGGVVSKESGQMVPGIRISKETPPCFFAHAGNDPVPAENSIQMYLALKHAGVPAELHIYSIGGHGFGMRQSKNPVAEWPKRCEDWLRVQGILTAAAR
jgi:acetyl esterase/lipase